MKDNRHALTHAQHGVFHKLATLHKDDKVMISGCTRISRQPFRVKITIGPKNLENVESFKYLGSILTSDGRCTCEIKCRFAMAKAAFNKKRALFTSTLDLELRKKLVNCYILEHSFIWC